MSFEFSNTIASQEELELARKYGKPFVSVDSGCTVRGFHYKGQIWIDEFDIDLSGQTFTTFDRYVGYAKNFLAFLGLVGFVAFLGLYSAGFFHFYAENYPDSFIGQVLGSNKE